MASSAAQSLSFLSKTLSAVQTFPTNQNAELATITQNALQDLLTSGLIRQRKPDMLDMVDGEDEEPVKLEVTNLGRATFKSKRKTIQHLKVTSISFEQIEKTLCHIYLMLKLMVI